MPQSKIITAIDVGTDKCVTLIATEEPQTGGLKVMGVSAVPARGMKRSQIIDLEKVLESITESLDGAERMAGLDVKSAFVSVSGAHINSKNSKGVVAVASPDQEIISSDVERVIDASRAISLSSDREIIHVIPKDYKVDSQEGIKDPVGMTGVRLESEAHIITGLTSALKNLQKCIEDVGITVEGFVFSGLAASEVVLTETEKELGVALVDIGAGSTSICAYVDGTLEYSGAIPVGARHITQDIALGTKVSIDVAEKIKLFLSEDSSLDLKPLPGEARKDFVIREKKADDLRLANFEDTGTDEVLSKKFIINDIITARVQEIFELVASELENHQLLSEVRAGIVLTGGGAETAQIAEIARRQLNMPVRIGHPTELAGIVSDIQKPSYATSIGLLVYGNKLGGGEAPRARGLSELTSTLKSFNPLPLFRKLGSLFKSLLP